MEQSAFTEQDAGSRLVMRLHERPALLVSSTPGQVCTTPGALGAGVTGTWPTCVLLTPASPGCPCQSWMPPPRHGLNEKGRACELEECCLETGP